MIARILLFSLLLSLVACASSLPVSKVGTAIERKQVMNMQASREGYSLVYIYRPSEFQNLMVDYLIGFDPLPVVTLENETFTRIEIPPGVYKFVFASDPKNYNTPAYAFSYSGQNELEVRADTVNVVHFDAYPGSFSSIKYGVESLNVLADLDYLVPSIPVVSAAVKLTDALPIENVADTKAAEKTSKASALSIAHFNTLKQSALCRLESENWAYTGKECNSGLAHGVGSSEDNTGLRFVGEFQNGKRVKGEIFQNEKMIFAGQLLEDKPHGSAICFHEGEYEECRFYNGKRIDSLYKIRKENVKMTQKMASLQQAKASSGQNGSGLADDVQREALNRAASFIFDSLF